MLDSFDSEGTQYSFVVQVNQLTKLGVKAVSVGKSSQLSDISSGRYRFGMSGL